MCRQATGDVAVISAKAFSFVGADRKLTHF
jgi:hypothetical protein